MEEIYTFGVEFLTDVPSVSSAWEARRLYGHGSELHEACRAVLGQEIEPHSCVVIDDLVRVTVTRRKCTIKEYLPFGDRVGGIASYVVRRMLDTKLEEK